MKMPLLHYPLSIGLVTAVMYALWWFHNDHPFLAVLAAAIGIVFYDELVGIQLGILHERINELEKQQEDEDKEDDDHSRWSF